MNVTSQDIRYAIRKLGLSQYPLCVHASLRSFGTVEAGAVTVMKALLAEGCTILVPASAWSIFAVKPKLHQLPERNGGSAASWRTYFESQTDPLPGAYRIYSPDTKEIDKSMGAIPKAVVAHLHVIRGDHPLFSFAAVGPQRHTLIQPQSPLNVFGPLKALVDNDGYLVLMGVDLTVATFLHYVEEVAGRVPFRRWANDKQGQPTEVTVGGCSEGFERLAPYLASAAQTQRVGDSLWRVYQAERMLSLAQQVIKNNPEITRCSFPNCERCEDAILGGPLLTNRPFQSVA